MPPTIDALLVHQEFLRGLARGLLGRHDLADDVVQETWLQALRRPPRHGGSPRGWLGTVARHAALRLRQREARRPRVQATSLRDRQTHAAPSPAEVLEREVLRQRVVRAVLALPERDREVLLLRYYEDLPPRAIAVHLEVPVETVRTRVKRALARLRAALDDETEDWRGWALGVAPPGGLRAAGAAALGGIAMKKLLLLVGGLAALLLAGWWAGDALDLFRGGAAPSGEPALLQADTEADPGAQTGEPRLSGLADATADEAAPYGVVFGRVVDLDGHPVPGARVWVASTRAPRWMASVLTGPHHAVSDVDGRFRFAPQEPANRVRAVADGYVSDAEDWPGGSASLLLVLRRCDARVEGTLRDVGGRPVAGAVVLVASPYGTQPDSVGRSDPTGRFSVPFVTGLDAWVGAWAPGLLMASAEIPRFDAAGHASIDLVLRPAFEVEGRVTDAETGEGISGAIVSSYERFGPVPLTGRDGRFRYTATSEIDRIWVSHDGYPRGEAGLVFRDGRAHADLALVPLRQVELHGLVVDADGEPVADALVLTGDARRRTRTDPEGRFRHVAWVGPGESVPVLVACSGEVTPAVVARPEPTEAIALRLGRPAPVEGRVLLASGAAAAGATLTVRPGEGPDAATHGLALAALGLAAPQGIAPGGAFRLVGLPAGSYVLRASPGVGQNALPIESAVEVHPGRSVSDVELRMPAGRVLAGRVVDGDGAGVPFADLGVYGTEDVRHQMADAEGRFRIPALPASRITLHVKAPGYRLWHGDFTVTDEPVTVTMRRCVRLCFRLEGEAPPSGSWAMVWFREPGRGGWGGAGSFVVQGAVVHDLIHGPETYEYVLRGDGWQTEPVLVEPEADVWEVEVPVAVVPSRAARYSQVFETNPGEPPPSQPEAPAAPETPPETGSIRGTVTGAAGDFGGTAVVARGPRRTKVVRAGDSDFEVDDTPTHEALVGADGSYRLDRVPAGAWTLSCRRGSRHENEVQVTVVANETIEVDDLRAPARGPTIRGLVLDAEDRPVAGLEVEARPLTWRSRHGRARTASDGTFEIDDLEAGSYALTADDERGRVASRTVEAGSAGVELRFTRYGLVRGTLAGPWGDEDFAQGRVFVEGLSAERFSTSASLQRNGAVYYFECRLPPGAYELRARAGPFVTAEPLAVTVRAGETASPLAATLVRGVTLSVVLVDASGEQQRKGLLDVPPAWHLDAFPEPDEDGVFRFASVPPGTWTLTGRARAGIGQLVLDLAAGETVRREIVLRK